jgi:hypothetical protein
MPPSKRLTLRELLVVGLCATAFVVLRTVLRLPIHLPGHNAAVFVVFLVVAAGAVGRAPAATAMAAVAGILSLLAGIGTADGPAVVLRYLLPGLMVDALLVARIDACGRARTALLVGAVAGLLKLGVSLGWAAVIGQPADWLIAKAVVAGPVHAVSGGLGGLAGGLLVARLQRAGLAPPAP